MLRIPALLLVFLAASGCNAGKAPFSALSGDNSASGSQQIAEIRSDLEQIPPPAKSRYLAVKSLTSWENPYLTVQGAMVTLHVTLADANTSTLGEGGLLRPVGARRENLNVRTSDLPTALNAIPTSAWPYGRVIAIEEAHDAPPSAVPQLRRNMEAVFKTVGDLGVVGYEWQPGGSPGLH